jgi:flavin-dependent dehydrogenase
MNAPATGAGAAAEAMDESIPESCDLAIIGGGPAGSCLATLAAERGWKVVLLEKDCHPRFHIGESLLPKNLEIFEQLGLDQAVAQIGVYKAGAEFFLEDANTPVERIRFDNALDCRYPHAWQVRREDFDKLLFERARAAGAVCVQGAKVCAADFPKGAPANLAIERAGQKTALRAGFVADASGRQGFLARMMDLRRANREHASAAVYGHFEGVQPRPDDRAGDISICWFEHGWMWMIPLRDGVMSVGAVCDPGYLKSRRGSPQEFLLETIAHNGHVAARMENARLVMPVTATGNYSYQATRAGGERWLLIGDAHTFIDPVFSSGVLMAMSGARAAVPIVEAALRGQSTRSLMRRYERRLRRGARMFSWFIYRFNTPTMRHLFFHRRNVFRIEQAVISVLAGDVYDNPAVRRRLWLFRWVYFFTALAQGRRAWHARRKRLSTGATRHEQSA